MVIRLEGWNALASDYLPMDASVESDYEGDLTAVGGGPPDLEEKRGDQACAVLTTGSFSTYVRLPSCLHLLRNNNWKALFFYRCTGVIFFAPLKSRGVDARSDYIRKKKRAAALPPCSPKSIYVLAGLVGESPINRLMRETDVVNRAGDAAAPQPRTCRYKE